jgi:formylglycine-generating enzyme required for sulfatase activity
MPTIASNTVATTQSASPTAAVAPANTAAVISLAPSPALETFARPRANRPWTNSLGMRFVPVPGMRPLFGVWETRRADYEAFVQATPAHRAYHLRPPPFPQSHPNEPAVKVSWSNAVAFCRWLTESERQKGPLSSGQAYRLPSDAEWSLAVGLTNEPGKTLSERVAQSRLNDSYPWGAAWPPPKGVGNFRGAETRHPTAIPRYDDGAPFTAAVGRFGTNRWGLADLSGNVWEWCLQETTEPLRVARGGAWDTSDPRELRSAYRYTLTPGTELDSLGFRCVLDLGE